MRRNISILLLAIMLLPVGLFMYMQLKQAYIRYSVEARMENRLLKTLRLPKENITRINSKEVRIFNQLFDISSYKEEGNTIIITGIFDEEETAVVQQINQASHTSKEDHIILTGLFQLLATVFFHKEETFFSKKNAVPFPNYLSVVFTSPVRKVLLPPPQAAC